MSTALPDPLTETPWARLTLAVGAPAVVFLAGMALTIGFDAEMALLIGHQRFLYLGVAFFVLVPGLASLAPRIVGSDKLGHRAIVAVTLFVAFVLAVRQLVDIVDIALTPRNLVAILWVDLMLTLGVYVGARTGSHAPGRVWVKLVAAGAVFIVFSLVALAPVLAI